MLEKKYYIKLRDMQKKGLIKNLELQPVFELIPAFCKNGKRYRKCVYISDFKYFDTRLNKTIVLECKRI